MWNSDAQLYVLHKVFSKRCGPHSVRLLSGESEFFDALVQKAIAKTHEAAVKVNELKPEFVAGEAFEAVRKEKMSESKKRALEALSKRKEESQSKRTVSLSGAAIKELPGNVPGSP